MKRFIFKCNSFSGKVLNDKSMSTSFSYLRKNKIADQIHHNKYRLVGLDGSYDPRLRAMEVYWMASSDHKHVVYCHNVATVCFILVKSQLITFCQKELYREIHLVGKFTEVKRPTL